MRTPEHLLRLEQAIRDTGATEAQAVLARQLDTAMEGHSVFWCSEPDDEGNPPNIHWFRDSEPHVMVELHLFSP